MTKRFLLFLFILVLTTNFLISSKKPDEFLGFKLGSDGNLAHYNQIKEYFIEVGKESPRVKTFLIGKTTLGNDMVMAVISSAENIKNLKKYKEISKKLSLGEVDEAEAKKLAQEGKAIVFVTCNLHSTEIGSSQMSMEILYKFAKENSRDILNILDNVIFVLVPSANPDGQIMVVEWYRKNKGTKFEGGSLPYLYHWYAGHDNNRDWFKINLKETWNITRELYFNWFPQVEVDEHQMGSSGDRFFIPPFQDPPTPGVHPLVWRSINLIGSGIAFDLEQLDYRGVASRGFFTGSWIGALDDTAWFHNIPGILFEAASVRIATPIFIESEEVRSPESRKNEERMFSPSPWKGGWWRLRDIVNYDLHGTLSVLKTVTRNREEFLLNSYKMATDNIKRGKLEIPFAFIVPKEQLDPMTAEKFVKTILKANIRVYKTKKPLYVKNSVFKKGSFVVPLAQPYRSFVKNIFEKQHYPDLRKNLKDDPILPYDMAGWTLPIGMGVSSTEINEKFKVEVEPVELDDVYKRDFPETSKEYIILDSRFNNSYLAASVLLKKKVKVWRNYTDPEFEKGSFIVKKSDAFNVLKDINKKNPLIVKSVENLDLSKYKKLKNIRVALYQNWGGNMTEGWTRYVFDEFKINYETVHNKDILKKDFTKKYDVLIFVDASESVIESGKPPKRYERWYRPLPPEYSGGIGKEGEKVLKKFFESGKTMVFMDSSCGYAIKKFKLPVTDISEGNSKIVCPGSYLEVKIKDSEITFGMDEKAAVFYRRAPVFRTSLPKLSVESRRTPVVFGMRDLLLSGWLAGEEHLARKSLVVDYKKNKGRIILIGPDIIHRAQSEGTYKLMFNSIFAAAK